MLGEGMSKTIPFVCNNSKCARAGEVVLYDTEMAAIHGDTPPCDTCGEKDTFQSVPAAAQNLIPELSRAFVVKDSGKRQDFATGARRDTQDGKGDFSRVPMSWIREMAQMLQQRAEPNDRVDLVPMLPLLRLSSVYGRGGFKYTESNWTLGIPLSRYISSAMRHLISWAEGDVSEDHLAQAAWNCFSAIWTESAVIHSQIPEEIGDYGPLVSQPNCRVLELTGLCMEPGGQQILPLKPSEKLHRFRAEKNGYAQVIWRRAGAVILGWVPAEHLAALCPSPSPSAEDCSAICTEHPWPGKCSGCSAEMQLTMARVHTAGAVCDPCLVRDHSTS